MKKLLLLPLLLSSVTVFASDLTYYDSDKLLNQSLVGKQVSQTIEEKFKPQQTEISNLTVLVKGQESQLAGYVKAVKSYNDLSATDKVKYDSLLNSYQSNRSKLAQATQTYNSQRAAVIKYANVQLNILANGVVKTYALSHNLQAVYRANQFGYVDKSFDVTGQLLAQFNAADASNIITTIKTAKVGADASSSSNSNGGAE